MSETPQTTERSIDNEELAQQLVATVNTLAEEIEADDDGSPDAPEGMMDPQMALAVIGPALQQWAIQSPEEVLSAVARIQLEAESLLDYHTEDTTAAELL